VVRVPEEGNGRWERKKGKKGRLIFHRSFGQLGGRKKNHGGTRQENQVGGKRECPHTSEEEGGTG